MDTNTPSLQGWIISETTHTLLRRLRRRWFRCRRTMSLPELYTTTKLLGSSYTEPYVLLTPSSGMRQCNTDT